MKYYITFGQAHIHKVNGVIFDKDCVAVIDCENPEQGDEIAFRVFDRKFSRIRTEEPTMSFYPRGLISLES